MIHSPPLHRGESPIIGCYPLRFRCNSLPFSGEKHRGIRRNSSGKGCNSLPFSGEKHHWRIVLLPCRCCNSLPFSGEKHPSSDVAVKASVAIHSPFQGRNTFIFAAAWPWPLQFTPLFRGETPEHS